MGVSVSEFIYLTFVIIIIIIIIFFHFLLFFLSFETIIIRSVSVSVCVFHHHYGVLVFILFDTCYYCSCCFPVLAFCFADIKRRCVSSMMFVLLCCCIDSSIPKVRTFSHIFSLSKTATSGGKEEGCFQLFLNAVICMCVCVLSFL